jgi:hypothetical protein
MAGGEELARQHGLYAVAHPLRLDYVRLKRRLEAVSKVEEKKRKKKVASPGFVELIAAHPAAAECVIEFESELAGPHECHGHEPHCTLVTGVPE